MFYRRMNDSKILLMSNLDLLCTIWKMMRIKLNELVKGIVLVQGLIMKIMTILGTQIKISKYFVRGMMKKILHVK
ncbi:hypothetical protein CVR98_25400 [Salmonella enterica subsp. enterica serovar Enteritidis]|nr:hypothetical protein CVR98_25400 [Salmonella enterica subsp. enterica serovar Enteritidis]